MLTRREFLVRSALVGAGMTLYWKGGTLYARTANAAAVAVREAAQQTLDPATLPKYETDLVIPPAMPRTGRVRLLGGKIVDYYEIAVRQFQQQILPAGLPPTTVWGYGNPKYPATFNYPSFTIEARYDIPVRVKWINDLKDSDGNFLPHLLPVDQTLHWANPSGGKAGRDMQGTDGNPYSGPVPMVTHVHGAHTSDENDGYAEAWYLPAARNLPLSYAAAGSKYDYFKLKFLLKRGVLWQKGSATYQYPNDQAAATIWYHDHSLGMTRLNVYAGPAGFYLLRGGPNDLAARVLPGPAPALGDPAGTKYYEIPIAIQDRSFKADGSLFYPDSREFFDGFGGPYLPDPASDVPPIWNPEFFGDTMVVNGKVWPRLKVEPRRYRFRFLNGCNSRFLILKLATGDPAARPASTILPFWQIGTEGGFLPQPVLLDQLLMSPAERADVIVDFTGLPFGTIVYLVNVGPDEPYGGGEPDEDFAYADPMTTGQVMSFEVGTMIGTDNSQDPSTLILPAPAPLGAETVSRQVSLNEMMSMKTDAGPIAAVLGTVGFDPSTGAPIGVHKMWMDPITENPTFNATEVWEIYNFTVDAHPIHLHEVQFQVVDRQPIGGLPYQPMPWERGFKDTVIAYPGEITRIKAKFDLRGLYVWHCHIVEHEDNEMMRPYYVGWLGGILDANEIEGEEKTEDADYEEDSAYHIFLPEVNR